MGGIKRCWRKAGIIHSSCNYDINKNVGSDYVPNQYKVISKEECHDICSITIQIHLRSSVPYSKWPSVCIKTPELDASFITEHDAMTLQDTEWTNMVNNCMAIEDEEDLINEDIDEVLKSIDNGVVELKEEKSVEKYIWKCAHTKG